MFEICSGVIKEDEELVELLKTSITQHFQSFDTEFKRYFPELQKQEAAFVRNAISTVFDVGHTPDKLQDRFMICELIRPHVMFFRKCHSLSILVCYARILPTTIQTSFLNVTSIFHNIPLESAFQLLFSSKVNVALKAVTFNSSLKLDVFEVFFFDNFISSYKQMAL